MSEANDVAGTASDGYDTISDIEEAIIDEAIEAALSKKGNFSMSVSADNSDKEDDDDDDDIDEEALFIEPPVSKKVSKNKTTGQLKGTATIGKSPWLSIEKKIKNKNGEIIITYPFVEHPKNEQDEKFISLLNFYRPFKHGGKNAAWEKLRTQFSTELTLEGQPIFQTVPCVRSLRNRLGEYKKFVKKHINKMNVVTGCDNIQNTDLLGYVYDIVSLMESEEAKAKKFKEDKLLKDQQNRAAASEHRDVSLGIMKTKRGDNQPSDLSEEDESNSKANSKSSRKKNNEI